MTDEQLWQITEFAGGWQLRVIVLPTEKHRRPPEVVLSEHNQDILLTSFEADGSFSLWSDFPVRQDVPSEVMSALVHAYQEWRCQRAK